MRPRPVSRNAAESAIRCRMIVLGAAEEVRDRTADSLAEIPGLDIRRMFSGYGFYVDGLLVAAAWGDAFKLRYQENGHWV